MAGDPKPHATWFVLPQPPGARFFDPLTYHVESFLESGKSPYPVERTHLVTGMLAAAMDSRFEQHQRLQTPHLALTYAPRDYRTMREMGATWKIITNDVPQPKGLESGNPHPKR